MDNGQKTRAQLVGELEELRLRLAELEAAGPGRRIRSAEEEQHRESEPKLSSILSSMGDLVFAFDQQGRFTFYHSPNVEDLYLPPAEFLGKTPAEVLPAHVSEPFGQAFARNRQGEPAQYECWLELGGQRRWYAVNSSPLFSAGEFTGVVVVARDITKRKRAESAVQEANRGLHMLSECNRMLSRAREEVDLLRETCRLAVDIGGYRLAWVGYAEQDLENTVRPVAQAGYEEGYLDRISLTWADTEAGCGPTGTAIRTGQVAIAQNIPADPSSAPWREEATRRGYASSIALPLLSDGRCLGALNIYAAEPDFFDAEEVDLLTELADNLAYGIGALRTRAEHARVEDALHRYIQRLEILHQVDRAILEAQSPQAIARATLASIEPLVLCDQASIGAFGLEADRPTLLAVYPPGQAEPGRYPALAYRTDNPLEAFEVTDEFRMGRPRLVKEVLNPSGWNGGLAYPGASWPQTRGQAVPPHHTHQQRPAIRPENPPGVAGQESGDVRCVIDIPLVAEGELIGVLQLASSKPDAFPAEQIEIAYEVAAPLALAIQHARLHEQLQQYAGGLEETMAQRTRELRVERDRTHAILEALGEAVIVTDVEGRILYGNPALTTLTGYRNDEVTGKSWPLLQGSGSVAEAYAQAQSNLPGQATWRGELVSRRRDDTLYDAAVTVAPLFDPEQPDQLVGSVWVQRDITLLKQAERLKDQFVSNVSHELRTPLSIITLVAGNLDKLYDRLDDGRRREMIQTIREHVGVLSDLVGDVLEISQLDSGRISRERHEVDLTLLVREEVERQRPLARRKSHALEVVSSGPLAVRGNEGQLRQIVRNLLNNAIKFTPAGGVITCECLAQSAEAEWGQDWPGSAGLEPGHWAALRVTDTGIGIEEKDLARLFERFSRLSTQGDIPGTGLGLAISRELVEMHGGHIAVTSTPGQGSVFAIYLPLGEEEAVRAEEKQQVGRQESGEEEA